jgi:hypothetical protein
LLLSACRGSAYQVALPNGGYAWAVECDVAPRCYEKIGDVCDHGYRLVGRDSAMEDRSDVVATQDLALARSRRGERVTLMFVCR